MNLYELSADLVTLAQMEDIEEVEQVKAIVQEQIEAKNTGIVAVVRNLESTVDAIDTEIKRLQDLKKVKKNNIDRLMQYTKECMELRGVRKVETTLGNISIRKTPPSVNILDETRIPLDYINIKQVESIDKKLLLSDLKNGLVLDGIAEIKQGTSLTIK